MSIKRRYYTVVREPQGDLYVNLLDAAGVYTNYAQIVIRHSITLSDRGKEALNRLQPFLHNFGEAEEWPGTKLIGDTATIFRYFTEPACIETLKELSNALYEWRQPELPEDLCFFRRDGSPWFGSISHEGDSFFILSADEYSKLVKQFPVFPTILREDETFEED